MSTEHLPNTLPQWLAWLETLHPSEIELGLSRIHSVAQSLKLFRTGEDSAINSDGSVPRVITVAGTNGKGSFVKACESILAAAGAHFGCFTSPHITRYNERIRVDGVELSDAYICSLFEEINSARGDTSLTYFEFGTLAALLAFHKLNCEYWVLEVGLGGRLDAVNIIDADVGVITSIGLDHESWLGNTVEAIGREKAGILRVGQTVVLATEDLPFTVYDTAEKLDTFCMRRGVEFDYIQAGGTVEVRLASGERAVLANSSLPQPSLVAAMQAMASLGLNVTSREVLNALESCSLEGRFEVQYIAERGCLVFDVAHNPMATTLLAENLAQFIASNGIEQVDCVLAMMADKNMAESLVPLTPLVNRWRLCDLPNNARASTGVVLKAALEEAFEASAVKGCESHALNARTCESVEAAISELLPEELDPQGAPKRLILVCGSFFTVSAAKAFIQNTVGTNCG